MLQSLFAPRSNHGAVVVGFCDVPDSLPFDYDFIDRVVPESAFHRFSPGIHGLGRDPARFDDDHLPPSVWVSRSITRSITFTGSSMNSRLTGTIPKPCTAHRHRVCDVLHLDYRHHRFLDSGAFQLHPEYIFGLLTGMAMFIALFAALTLFPNTSRSSNPSDRKNCLYTKSRKDLNASGKAENFFEVLFFRNLNQIDFPEFGHLIIFLSGKSSRCQRPIKIASQ